MTEGESLRRRLTANEVKRAERRYYISHGLCPICKSQRLFGDEHWCIECRLKKQTYQSQYLAKEENKRRHCRQASEANKRMHDRRKAQGLCTYCGKKLTDTRYVSCKACRAKNTSKRVSNDVGGRDKYQQLRKERIKNGICPWCGKDKSAPGYVLCTGCLAKNPSHTKVREKGQGNANSQKKENVNRQDISAGT